MAALPLSTSFTLPSGLQYEQPLGLFINNEFVATADTSNVQDLTTYDPSTGEPITNVHCATAKDVDIAVKAANNAMKTWKDVDPVTRVNLMLKLASLVDENKQIIAEIESWDSGKPLYSNAMADVESVANYLRYCAGWADKLHGTQIPLNSKMMAITKRVPLVVGCIVPWNYPISMASWKFCPALAAGCTIVIKSSEITPLSLLYFAKLTKLAGFPPGVFNVLSGYGKDTGSAISKHPGLGKVAFTGSTATGQKVMTDAANSNLKSVSLECGGKSPLLVFDDADLIEAAKWASFGVMYNTGQNCTANSRILVDEKVHDKFVEIYLNQLKEDWKMGDVFKEDVNLGPVVSQGQFDRVQNYIKIGVEEGATLNQPLADKVPQKGFYISPTVFTNVKEDMRIVKEEIFGPVVTISKFSSEDDAIEKANDTIYGLAAMLFSTNFERANRVADQLQAGSVYINSSNNEDVRVPFGGFKMSGIGRELGAEAFNLYTVTKSIYCNYGSKL
jgi:aldehyde dehydrogenase (NAD(P)+)